DSGRLRRLGHGFGTREVERKAGGAELLRVDVVAHGSTDEAPPVPGIGSSIKTAVFHGTGALECHLRPRRPRSVGLSVLRISRCVSPRRGGSGGVGGGARKPAAQVAGWVSRNPVGQLGPRLTSSAGHLRGGRAGRAGGCRHGHGSERAENTAPMSG